MKKLMAICLLIIVFLSCKPKPESSDYWEYQPGRWIAFKEKLELAWDYDELKIDKFEIDREMKKLEPEELIEIEFLVSEKRIEGLAARVNILRSKIKYDKKITVYRSTEDRSFIDKEEPLPSFNHICFYQVKAVKNNVRSAPAELSVIFIKRPE